MPSDPRHGRNIPRGFRVASVIAQWLRVLRRWAIAALQTVGIASPWAIPNPPDPPDKVADQVADILAADFGRGWKRSVAERKIRKRPRRAPKPPRTPPGPAGGSPPQPPDFPTGATGGFDESDVRIVADFRLLLPEVREKFKKYSLDLIRGISDTTRERVRTVLDHGLKHGESVDMMARKLRPMFSKKRARLIAQTESSRALHAGQVEAGIRAGEWGTQWLASSDACPVCESINGKRVPHGGIYLTGVPHPPAHPNCRCAIQSLYPEDVQS